MTPSIYENQLYPKYVLGYPKEVDVFEKIMDACDMNTYIYDEDSFLYSSETYTQKIILAMLYLCRYVSNA